MDHIGIDVHRRESEICVLAEGGEVIERVAAQDERVQRLRTVPQRSSSRR